MLTSRNGIGWKGKLTIRLNDHAICVQPIKMEYMVDEMNEMDCGLKEMKWNMKNKVWTEENEMKYEQWSVDWRKWDETWTVKSIL